MLLLLLPLGELAFGALLLSMQMHLSPASTIAVTLLVLRVHLLLLLLQNVLYELSLAEATGMKSREAEPDEPEEKPMDTDKGNAE